jgi:hypothetical protein
LYFCKQLYHVLARTGKLRYRHDIRQGRMASDPQKSTAKLNDQFIFVLRKYLDDLLPAVLRFEIGGQVPEGIEMEVHGRE